MKNRRSWTEEKTELWIQTRKSRSQRTLIQNFVQLKMSIFQTWRTNCWKIRKKEWKCIFLSTFIMGIVVLTGWPDKFQIGYRAGFLTWQKLGEVLLLRHNNNHFPIKTIFAAKFSVFLDGALENLYFIRLDAFQKNKDWLVAYWSSLEQLYDDDFFS